MIERERDESVAEDTPATHSTDPDEEQKDKKDQDATVDEQSEQSMDGSDAPAW